MARTPYRWVEAVEQPELARTIREATGVSAPVARVLANRGMAADAVSAAAFLDPRFDQMHDPRLMKGLGEAAEAIEKAHRAGKRIVVYGDYDTDGTTSTVVMLRTFALLGVAAGWTIPRRLEDGYGLNAGVVRRLADEGCEVLVTVDNGITAIEEVRLARELGMQVVVTDHHQPEARLPDADVVVNPNQPGCEYPNKALTGVGVAYKLAHALLRQFGAEEDAARELLRSLLPLVALGTVADVSALVGENRVLVAKGLERLRSTKSVGLTALMQQANVDPARASTYSIGFQLAPRLNAAGRTADARICVELLMTEDADRAARLAAELEEHNAERRRIEAAIIEDAMVRAQEQAGNLVIVVAGEGWHEGVIGIVAGRLMEAFHRPAVVLAVEGDVAKGSARSISAYSIHAGLTASADCLLRFGGHMQAAGLTMETRRIAELRERLNDHAAGALKEEDLVPRLRLDTTLEAEEVTFHLLKDLMRMEPHGMGNPKPMFALRGVRLSGTPRVVGANHLRMDVRLNGAPMGAIAFSQAELIGELGLEAGTVVDLACTPKPDTFRGDMRIQLDVKDLRVAGPTVS